MSELTTSLTTRQKRLFAFLTLGLVLLLTLGTAEILVRLIFRYNTPETIRAGSLQYTPTVITRHLLEPNQRVIPDAGWDQTAQGSPEEAAKKIYATNSMGYRGKSFEVPKPENTCRIIVLGGSAVFDLGATEGEDWPYLLEEKLQQSEQLSIEVINAGVPGHASFDALGKLYGQIWMFEPDFVLLYNAWNDLKYFTTVTPETPLITQVAPHNPQADPFQHYRGFLDRLLGHSQLYMKLRNRYFLWKYELGTEGQVAKKDLATSFKPAALGQYQLQVELVVDASRNIGAQPILLTQASLLAANNSAEDRARIAYRYQGLSHEALVSAFAAANQTLRQVAEAKQADWLDLDASLSGRPELFDDHIHTSRLGSEALAEHVAQYLTSKLDPCRQ